MIVLRLLVRTRRFKKFLRSLPGCTQRTLTNQLRELEADGVVNRKVYAEVPPRVEYSLTASGRELLPVIRAMCEWGQVHLQGVKPDFEKALESAVQDTIYAIAVCEKRLVFVPIEYLGDFHPWLQTYPLPDTLPCAVARGSAIDGFENLKAPSCPAF